MSRNNAFITLKDHKPNFHTDTKCRLINPAKSEMGKVSSNMLKEINEPVRLETGLKQWRSTQEALLWFQDIEDKDSYMYSHNWTLWTFIRQLPKNFYSKPLDLPTTMYTLIPEQRKLS